MKCEKCGKEIKQVKINMFAGDGSDFDTIVDIVENEYGNAICVVDKNWSGYELTEEERIDTIMCPHCGEFPLKDEEIQVYDEVKVVMFKENYLDESIKTVKKLEDDWILCSERLPDLSQHPENVVGEEFLVSISPDGVSKYETAIRTFWRDSNTFTNHDNIIAWMPLPDPCQGK